MFYSHSFLNNTLVFLKKEYNFIMSPFRKIPATMVTQHPDHANKPYWHDSAFISTQQEPHEMYLSFSELGATEYKWDWEGKLVDEAVVERILGTYYDYFKDNPLGKEKFLTFRLPNPKVETEFRLGRAFMGILAASSLANQVGLGSNPLFEVILPMTETASEMIGIQEAFREVSALKHPLLKYKQEDIKHIELIPLFEDIETIAHSDEILIEYLEAHQQKFKSKPKYMRPYVARSDPALNAGIVPTVLSIKIALSRYQKLSEQLEMPLYPIIGAAALPFRGGINPLRIEKFINEYKGIRTTTIQSAFRYDFKKEVVIEALQKIEIELKKNNAAIISKKEEVELFEIMGIFSAYYKKTIEKIAPLINQIASFMPKRRERVQHTGLFGYSRGVGSVKLPRAISFTGSLYSIGIPPELIGTGRGLNRLIKQNRLELLEKYYVNLRSDLLFARKFLNIGLLRSMSSSVEGVNDIIEDITYIDKYLHYEEKNSELHAAHREISQDIYSRLQSGDDISSFIQESGKLRRSLG